MMKAGPTKVLTDNSIYKIKSKLYICYSALVFIIFLKKLNIDIFSNLIIC